MRILICDDDSSITSVLSQLITTYFGKKEKLKCPEIVSFDNGESLLSDNGDKDIVFLRC